MINRNYERNAFQKRKRSKTMKKFLCTLLSVALLASSLAGAVFADETTAGEDDTEASGFTGYAASITDPTTLPTCAPGPGLEAVVIMKPSDELDGASYIRFVFSADCSMNGYNAHWGIGSILPDTQEAKFYMGDTAHYLGEKYHYGSDWYTWEKDNWGRTYFQNVISIFPNENGKFVDGEGNEYDSQYDMAKAGQLMATFGEHVDPSGTGLVDGYINVDTGSCNVNMFGDAYNPFGGFDSNVFRVVTEEEFYDEDGNVKEANLALAVAHVADGTMTTVEGTYTGKLSFVFKGGWTNNTYECVWGVALLPVDEDTNLTTRPLNASGFNWYNCDSGADVIVNGEQKHLSWGDFEWGTDVNGDTVFTVVFQIPEEELKAAGYNTMEEAAMNSGLVAYIAEHRAGEKEGYVDCDAANGSFKANSVLDNGLDARIVGVVSGCDYYNEVPYTEETEAVITDAPKTDAPKTDGPTTGDAAVTTGSATEEKSGCGSTIGAGVLVLAVMAAAPVAFARKKH